MAAWFFVDDHHGLLPCGYTASHELELGHKKYHANPLTQPQCIDLAIAGVLYTVDVVLFEQLNPSTKRIRALRRMECPPTIQWEVETTIHPSILDPAAQHAPPGGVTFVPMAKYWCVVWEYLRLRLNSAVHKGWKSSPTFKHKTDLGEVSADPLTMDMQFSSFGGLVTTKGKVRRVIQAPPDDEEAGGAGAGTSERPAKRGRGEPTAAAPAPPPGRVPKTLVPEAAGGDAETPKKRLSALPATLRDDTPDSKHGPPVHHHAGGDEVAVPVEVVKRGPGHSHRHASEDAPAVVAPRLPPGWGAPAAVSAPPPASVPKKRLVFPSFSTAVFMFDLPTAAKTACGVIAKFLAAHPHHAYPWIDICLIDAPKGPDTETIVQFKKHWAAVCPAGETRLSFITADVTSFAERGEAFCIANASNAYLNGGPSTGGFNRAIYVAAGEKDLQADTRATYPKGGSVGPCYEVPLRTTSPLYAQGTRYVLHVVGPNMNPTRPNCLYDDYKTGCDQLADCYLNMLSTYGTLASSEAA